MTTGCPWCLQLVTDADTIQEKGGVAWHARCKDAHDQAKRMFGDTIAAGKQKVQAWDQQMVCVPLGIIEYHMSNKEFKLVIPANCASSVDRSRIYAMLDLWLSTQAAPEIKK